MCHFVCVCRVMLCYLCLPSGGRFIWLMISVRCLWVHWQTIPQLVCLDADTCSQILYAMEKCSSGMLQPWGREEDLGSVKAKGLETQALVQCQWHRPVQSWHEVWTSPSPPLQYMKREKGCLHGRRAAGCSKGCHRSHAAVHLLWHTSCSHPGFACGKCYCMPWAVCSPPQAAGEQAGSPVPCPSGGGRSFQHLADGEQRPQHPSVPVLFWQCGARQRRVKGR